MLPDSYLLYGSATLKLKLLGYSFAQIGFVRERHISMVRYLINSTLILFLKDLKTFVDAGAVGAGPPVLLFVVVIAPWAVDVYE